MPPLERPPRMPVVPLLVILPLAARADFQNPLFWAVFIAWILSVVLHEFAHGLVAHLGGDITVRERGGLSLNPIQYIDPVNSLILPAVFLLMGGVPLPGGVTYVRNDLLRSRLWQSAVSLAGPAMNALLFLACALPLHPRLGWVRYWLPVDQEPPAAQRLLATCAVLQLIAVMLNLMPIPPLDGFGAISPYLDPKFRQRLTTPPASLILLIGFFVVLRSLPLEAWERIYAVMDVPFRLLGFDEHERQFIHRSYNLTLLGKMD